MSILSRIQSNPEIGTDNEAMVEDLITRAKNFVVRFCNLQSFPELSQGYVESGSSPSTNISGLATNQFKITVNRYGPHIIDVPLTGATSGAAIASALQTAIQSSGLEMLDEVTVAYTSSKYVITSGRYGEDSSIQVTFDEDSKHLTQALKLSPVYGATEYQGNWANPTLEDAAVMLVEQWYRKIGLEGLSAGSIPGGVSFTASDMDKATLGLLLAHRRLGRG